MGFAETFHAHLTGDYDADIHMMARLQIADTVQKSEMLRLLLCDSQSVAELQDAMLQGAASNQTLLADFFRQQIAAGVVRADIAPTTLANAFDSLFSSYVLFERLMGVSPVPAVPTDAVVNSFASLFVQGTRAIQGS